MSLDRDALLGAVARFLEQDARPALTDPALAFRARVAAALLRSIAAENAAAEALESAELVRLRGLLEALDGRAARADEDTGDELVARGDPGAEADRRAALRTLERLLCDRVRAGLPADALRRAREAVREGLRARLAATTPDFDPSEDLP